MKSEEKSCIPLNVKKGEMPMDCLTWKLPLKSIH